MIANIGEAVSSLSRGDRRRYFEYAYRSAGECSALFIAFHTIGALTEVQYDSGRVLLHRIQMMLMRRMQRSGTLTGARRSAKPADR